MPSDRLQILDSIGRKWADWDRNPPKSHWDVERRSIHAFIEMAEIFLAKLKSCMADFPADKAPDFQAVLELMDLGREAARHAGDIDGQLTIQLERAQGLLRKQAEEEQARILQSVATPAHEHCKRNKAELAESKTCGCFYCGKVFKPGEITEWIENEQTAMCPYCGIDSVIGSASQYPVTEAFMEVMHQRWFATNDTSREIS